MPLLYTPTPGKLYKAKKAIELGFKNNHAWMDKGGLYLLTKYQPHGWKSTLSCNMAVDVSRIIVWFLVGRQEYAKSFSVNVTKFYSEKFEDLFEENKL